MIEKIVWKLKCTKIKERMTSFAMVLLLFIVLIGTVAFFALGKLKIGSNTYDEIILSKDLVADILPPPEYIIESYLTGTEYMLADDTDSRKMKLDYINELKSMYDERHTFWLECQKNGEISDEISTEFLTKSYEAAEKFYDIFYNKMVPAVEENNIENINSAYEEMSDAYLEHRTDIDKVVELAGIWSSETERKSEMESIIYYILVIGIMILSIICGYIYSKLMSCSIIGEVEGINDVMERVSKGDLSVVISENLKTKDEFGKLALCIEITLKKLNSYSSYIDEIASVLNRIADGCMKVDVVNEYEGEFAKVKQALIQITSSLYNTLEQINRSADKVLDDSENVADLSTKLSDGASNQASILEELVASIEQIDNSIRDNAKGAINANFKVKDVTKSIEYGNIEMKHLLSAMSDIQDSSSKIEEIANAIASIAEKTNLLALNASIEAARAGDQGRGFAVVASEVGILAQQSSESARVTTNLIHEAMEAVNKGVALADHTAKALIKVVDGAQEITTIMDKIEMDSKMQSEAVSQIAEGVEEIAHVVDANVVAASVSADASGHLQEEVNVLKKLVDRFEL